MIDCERLIAALEAIRGIADGRRHYEGEECFTALGDIRDIVDKVLGE